MPQALTRETRTLREPSQIKVNFKLYLKLPEANHTPEVSQEAMITPEVVAAIKLVQEIMKEEDLGTEMTDPNLKTDLSPKSGVVSDVEKPITNRRTATSRRKLV